MSFFDTKTAYAATFSETANNPSIQKFAPKIINLIISPIVEGLFVFATLILFWGIFQMMYHGDDSDARKTGQKHMFWGIVGMLIMVSVYGIIRVIGNTVGVGDPFR